MDRTAIGVDVGGTATKAGIVDEGGRLRLRVERPTETAAGTKGILAVVEDLLARTSEVDATVACIGVGAAGFIDAASGSVTFSPNLVYDDPHIADAVKARTGLPVVVDNDANAAAWGARRFGTAQHLDHVAYITIGTGIGSGFIAEGRLLRGYSGAGAELGHTVIEIDGPQCKCGLRGCLEQFASGTGIARIARELLGDDRRSSILDFAPAVAQVTALDVARAARQYDETAREVLRRAGRALGIGLSNVANVFDPQVIVVGGGVVAAGEPYLGPARDTLAAMTNAQRRRPMRLDVATLGPDAGIIGAAALAFDEAMGDGSGAPERPGG